MEVGDLIRVSECGDPKENNWGCSCILCTGKSNRIGLVVNLAPQECVYALFDCGEMLVTPEDMKSGMIQSINNQSKM
tara:strand:+ start:326 stop:556 length:231 start_codon:yes stop_codon:yes gene_type:complete